MELYFLGTAAGTPTADRNVSCTVLKRGSQHLIFDLGDGAQRQMVDAGLGLKQDSTIFVSHLHGDHLTGLPALLQSYSLMRRSKPLHLVGPEDLEDYVESNLEFLDVDLTYPLQVTEVESGEVLEGDDYRVDALQTEHGVDSYAYSLQEFPREGRFRPEKAEERGIPTRYWRHIKSRELGKVPDRFDVSGLVSEPLRGRKVVLTGDTSFFEELAAFSSGADVLVHEATFTDELRERSDRYFHSSAREAAKVAEEGGVDLLVLTHFSARYSDLEPLVSQAREVFPRVVAARDFLRVSIPYPGQEL